MSTVRAAFNISSTIVKSIVKVAGFGFVADAIEGGQELYQLACSLKDETFGSAEAQMSGTLRNSISDELASIEQQLGSLGRDEKSIDLFIGRLETSAKGTITQLLNDENALGEAITEPENFHAYVLTQSAPERASYAPEEEYHLNSLLQCIADEYLTLARKSPNYNETALRATVEQLSEIRTALEELKDGQQELKDGQQKLEGHIKSLETAIDNIHTIRHNKQPNNTVWGSRPGPLEYWIERNPTCNSIALNDAIFGPDASDEATCCVLIGPAGSGKTRLAASIAKRCEDEEWTLIAWIDAESKDMIKNQVIAISEEKFGLQLKPNEYPEVQFNRALSSFPSQNREKILIVLDNVEKSASIDELLPKTPNVRVIVTTRHGGNWSHQHGWLPFNLSTFSRQESIHLLTQATGDDDKATANQIAQLLGDLPLAIGRAANTCAWLNINRLTQYYAMLQQYPTEKLLDSTVATRDSVGVISALQIAGASALERIVDPDIREYAENILSALCYLSEYGVPVHWLKDESDLFSMCAYSELIDSSLIDETTDGTTVSIHRLQAHAMRLHWTPDVRDKAAETTSAILTHQLAQISTDSDSEKAKQETHTIIEQLRAMSYQKHSHYLFRSIPFLDCFYRALTHLDYQINQHSRCSTEDLTLANAILLIAELSTSISNTRIDDISEQTLYKERVHKILQHFEGSIIREANVSGFLDPLVASAYFTLARAYQSSGFLQVAIDHYEQLLLNVCAHYFSLEDTFTMDVRNSLESARRELAEQQDGSRTEERAQED
jgi:ATP/GTP-binding protein